MVLLADGYIHTDPLGYYYKMHIQEKKNKNCRATRPTQKNMEA